MTFTIAIIGRPNVGKSTLFNRLVGKKLALVDDTPGVTRDRREGDGKLGDLKFTVIDTAGLEDAAPKSLEGRMRMQTEAAIDLADLSFFVMDARMGVTPMDSHFASILRRQGKPVVLIANKSEGRQGQAGLIEAFNLGLGEPVPLSAEHGDGFSDLYDAILAAIPEKAIAPEDEEELVITHGNEEEEAMDTTKPVRIAVIGRPNAGKSTLINTILGEERLLTGPEAGITRDTISVEWLWREWQVKLFDTAGIRKRARVVEKLEKLSVADALRAIRFAEVVVLLLDSTIPFEKQDLQLADLVIREGRALVVGLNKWDLVENPQAKRKELEEEATRLLPQVRGLPLIAVSGFTARGVDKLMEAVIEQRRVWSKRVSTGALNRWFGDAVEGNPPPAVSGRRVKMRFVTQVTTRPPTFVSFCTRPDAVPESYLRYLTNGIREKFDLKGVPIRFMLRKKSNPFDTDKD